MSLEINKNISILREFWNSIIEFKELGEDEVLQKEKMARRLLDMPIPSFSKNYFESQMHLLTYGLSDVEIISISKHYEKLKRLETIRDKYQEFAVEQKNDWNLVSGGSRVVPISKAWGVPRKFSANAAILWDEFQRLILDVFEIGDPIGDK
ncbi:MAG: hypothetical protein GX432_03750 [Candidatus Atribacteria bacterium]|nr:hypothetical protein [Candidatus Atribacteria bacterium]